MAERPLLVLHHKGDLSKTDTWLRRAQKMDPYSVLNRWGQVGVDRLVEATPKDTGKTSESWSYKVVRTKGGWSIEWSNSNLTVTGIPIAILLQYGHGTRGGTWVEGRDFINPTLRPIFDNIAKELWKEVEQIGN